MNVKSVSNAKRLTPAECAVIITIAILSKAGTPTTPKKIADYLKEDVQTVRNILERLRNKGLVISSLAFGLGGLARISSSSQVSGRERIHRLVDDIENILDQYPEILEWTKVNLGIEDKKKLMEFINERAEELRRAEEKRLESYGLVPMALSFNLPAPILTAKAPPVVPYDRMRLHIAALWGDVEIVELLLRRGADPNVKDDNGQTPLHIAALWGHVDVVRVLLEHRADPNAKDNDGKTPLHYAAEKGHVDVVRVLLERGADPRIADNRGHIPLDYAKDSTIRSLLESALRNNELRDSEGLQSS
jgi:hypothetical protein